MHYPAEQLKYPYSPLPTRGKLRFPDGKRVALILTFNLEQWDIVKETDAPYYAGGPAVLPDLLPGNTADWPNFAWREYGQRVGIWRLFELFDELGVPASCTTNAVTIRERPQMVRAALERGWELVAHNYEQGELLATVAHQPEVEEDIIRRTLATYEEFVGKPAKGWLSSSLRGTLNTPDILARHGLVFYCDIMNDDQPYMLETPGGRIVSTPYTNEINDFTLLTRRGHTTDEFRDILVEELNVLNQEAVKHDTGLLMNVGLHPHVTGRAYRIRAVREFLAHAKSLGSVWFTTREELARWYMANNDGHITEALVQDPLPGFQP